MFLPSTWRCRGFLTGAIRSPADLSEQDYRRVGQPRFAEEAFAKVGGAGGWGGCRLEYQLVFTSACACCACQAQWAMRAGVYSGSRLGMV